MLFYFVLEMGSAFLQGLKPLFCVRANSTIQYALTPFKMGNEDRERNTHGASSRDKLPIPIPLFLYYLWPS